MQFLVLGRDGADPGAAARRLAVRADHLALGATLTAEGHMWYGAALWDDDGAMVGSMLVMDFADRNELQRWLDVEPYVTGAVWETVSVERCNVREPWQFNRPKEFFDAR